MGKSGNKVDTKKMLICVLEIEWIQNKNNSAPFDYFDL